MIHFAGVLLTLMFWNLRQMLWLRSLFETKTIVTTIERLHLPCYSNIDQKIGIFEMWLFSRIFLVDIVSCSKQRRVASCVELLHVLFSNPTTDFRTHDLPPHVVEKPFCDAPLHPYCLFIVFNDLNVIKLF